MKKGAFIITGATGGLGSTLAETALHLGYPLALIARSKENLKSLRDRLKKGNSSDLEISIHPVDLRDQKKVENEVKAISKCHSQIRALINNAGTWMGTTDIERLKSTDIQDSLDLNFYSAFNVTMALLNGNSAKHKGDLAIINIGATSSTDAWIEVLPFCLAKGALRSFSKALARDLGPKGIHVAHCIIDGMLDNKRTKGLNPKLKQDRFIGQIALSNDIIRVALQEKSCWTSEWGVRPHNENW